MLLEVINIEYESLIATTEKLIAFQNILDSYGSGENLVLVEDNLLAIIMTSSEFGTVSKTQASNLRENLREIKNVTDYLSTYIRVDFSTTNSTEAREVANKIIRTISYNYFEKRNNFSPINLLCENTLDCSLYDIIGQYKITKNKLSLKINTSHFNGGGGQIKEHYYTNRAENKFCLCIVDNDKKHPNGPTGDTCKAFSTYDKGIFPFTQVFVLDLHEIESLIPHKTINQYVTKNRRNTEHIDSVDILKIMQKHNFFTKVYLDHKNGLTLNQAINLDNLHGPFWIESIKTLSTLPTKKHDNNCLNSGKCNCDPECRVIYGFGDKLLRESINIYKRTSRNKLQECLDKETENIWDNIGTEIFSWGCAPPAKAIS